MKFQAVKGKDVFDIEILDDGTIKTTTAGVSDANHSSGERFMADLNELTGAAAKVTRRPNHSHVHKHGSVTHSHD